MPRKAAPSLDESLLNARDPFLCVDGEAHIVWHNTAAEELLAAAATPLRELGDLLPPQDIRSVLSTTHYSTIESKLKDRRGNELKQTIVVIDISRGLLDSELFLLCFKSVGSESTMMAAREEFLATIAHDLKNPLGAIFGYADALLDTPVGAGLSAQQRDIISRVRHTAQRSVELVRNYQHLSALQSRSITPSQNTISLNAAVQNIVDYTWRDEQHSPKLLLNLAAPPPLVRLEKLHLERIVSNLFSNALKYTPVNGTIVITTGEEGGRPFMEVKNSGAVLTQSEIDSIFEKYTRAHNSSGIPGSGLGLYIVKYILDAVGGTIHVSSSEASGTSFKIGFPS